MNSFVQTWRCSVCTYTNASSTANCLMCELPKGTNAEGPFNQNMKSFGGTWKCNLCTFINPSSMSNCTMCGETDPLSQHLKKQNNDNLFDPPTSVMSIQNIIEQQFGKRAASQHDFEFVVADIAFYARRPHDIYSSLKSIIKGLLKGSPRYRIIKRFSRVAERLMGYEGVLHFLLLLGFRVQDGGNTLYCEEIPLTTFMMPVIQLLDRYMDIYHDDNTVCDSNYYHSMEQIITSICNIYYSMEQIITQYNEMERRLILTHKVFTNSITFLQTLHNNFWVMMTKEIKGIHPIQEKIVGTIRSWMRDYWYEDFYDNHDLQAQFQQWLESLSTYNQLDGNNNENCRWVQGLYKTLQNDYLLKLKNGDPIPIKVQNTHNLSLRDNDIHITDNYTADIANQITLIHHHLFTQIAPREFVNNLMHHQSISYNKETLLYHIADAHNPLNCLTAYNIITIVAHWHRNLPAEIVYLITDSYKAKNEPLAPNLTIFVVQFNTFVKFLQMEILREPTLTKRMDKIKRIIELAQYFHKSRDYYSLCGIFTMFKSKHIRNLESIWKHLSEEHKRKIQEWSVIFRDQELNGVNLRYCLMKCDMKSNPYIPHIGKVLLHDLQTIYSEGCSAFDDEIACLFCASKDPDIVCEATYSKAIRIAERIYQFYPHGRPDYKNVIKPDEYLQTSLRITFAQLKCIADDELCNMSQEIAEQDAILDV